MFDWPDSNDASLAWFRGTEHYPHPLTPLSVDLTNHVLNYSNTLNFLHDVFNMSPKEDIRYFFPRGFVYFNIPLKYRLHDLRHFHATTLVKAGVDFKAVHGRLGYSTPSLSLSIYAHRTAQMDDNEAQAFETAMA
jgi:integrase